MELSVGMYVRVKDLANICHIGKIYNINDFREPSMKYCIDIQASDFAFVSEDMIVKASHNIKELLQVGDIITYEFPTGLGMLKYENVTILEDLLDVLKSSDEYEILSIVTKEQFESMAYKVGE